jgi:glycosyltransferase involved in cell wall biosynthesis
MFTRMVSNSYYLAQRLEEAGWGRSEVIWNGVPEVLQRGPLGDSPEIGFSGRLIPEKGAETLIQAFAQLKPRIDVPMRLLVIGDGPERTRLERLCSKLSVASMVTFTGAMTREESERRLQRAWVQVVPSICQESFGLVAAEAQMRGTAAIVTRRGGLPEIIEAGKTGTLVDPQDPMQLAEAIWPYLVDRSKAERFGQAGRERALRVFHLDTCVSKFLELYDRVILEHRGKTSKGDTL